MHMKRRRGSCQVAAGDEETRRPVFPRSPFFVMSMRASPLILPANYKSQITSHERSNSDRLGFLNRTLLSHYIFAISIRKRSQKRSISLTRENRNIRMIKDISWLRGAWIAGLCSRRAQAFSIMQEGAKMSYSSWLCGNKCHMAGMRAPLCLCHAILIRVSHRKLLCREAVRLMRS